MSLVDVGDAFELTFITAPGATVAVSWYDPDLVPVYESQPVPESPAGSGKYPRTFVATRPGMWKVLFTSTGTATAVEQHWIRAQSVTGPAPLAVVGDVSAPFGTMTAAQEGLTGYLLRMASKLVRSQYPNIDAQIAAGQLDAEVVALNVAAMVLRVLRNPQGLRGKSVGPFSYTYDTTEAAGQLVIGKNEASAFTPVTAAAAAATAFGMTRIKAGMAPPVRHCRGW
jgi:hypothetical protein